MVRLKATPPDPIARSFTNFNSSMVRLKVTIVRSQNRKRLKFQFLYGAIKSMLRLRQDLF